MFLDLALATLTQKEKTFPLSRAVNENDNLRQRRRIQSRTC